MSPQCHSSKRSTCPCRPTTSKRSSTPPSRCFAPIGTARPPIIIKRRASSSGTSPPPRPSRPTCSTRSTAPSKPAWPPPSTPSTAATATTRSRSPSKAPPPKTGASNKSTSANNIRPTFWRLLR